MKYSTKKLISLILLVLIIFSIAPKIIFAEDVAPQVEGDPGGGGSGGDYLGGEGGGGGGNSGISGQYVPTFEVNPILTKAQPLANKITSIFQKAENVQQLLEWAFKLAVESLKRQLLNMIVDQIVAWIQGGGKPKFITDWPGFFRDAVDQAGGQFIQELGLGLFCSPFNLTLRAAFIPIPKFSDRSSCTLSSIGANIDNFLKNFNNGGWAAWNEMILKPQNNIYGAYLMAWDEYETRKSAAAKAAAAEAQADKGFLSVKRCIRSHEEIVGQYVSQEGNGPSITETVCDEYQTITPGAVVGELAAKAVGSDIDFIVNSDDLAAYVAAISNAVLNRMFAEGIGLLRMALSNNSGGNGGGGGNIGNSAAQQKCAPFLGTPAYNQCINSIQSGQDIKEFQKNYIIKIIDLDLGFQNQLLGAKQTTLIILNQSVDTLKRLEACQKFPHPDTAKTQNNARTIISHIAGVQSDIVALQLKQQQIKVITDLTQIPSFYAQVVGLVIPETTQSLALAAQEETNQKQMTSASYQQQLDLCIAEQERQNQQRQTPIQQ